MAQLSNDCFAASMQSLTIEAAIALAEKWVAPVTDCETLPLVQADGRVLAVDLIAPHDLPHFANAAVDGYAVRFDDLSPGTETMMPVVDRVIAGDGAVRAAVPGAAIRIFTGAPIPLGCDSVFMQEDVVLSAEGVATLPAGLQRGANLRPAGEDVAQGHCALPAGKRLSPQDLALAAALGAAAVTVRRRVRVAVFSTGNEVVEAGLPRPAGGLYDANRPMLIALLRRLGVIVEDFGILPDSQSAVRDALARAAAGQDLILSTGGVSTGEEDHVRTALSATGTLTFWRLAIKPGRPMAMGMVAGTPFMGLPGNPVAVFVTFVRIARPLIDRLAGAVHRNPFAFSCAAGFAYRKKAGRREYIRVILRHNAQGQVIAELHPHEGAGMISSLTESDALAELPEDLTAINPGDPLQILPYPSLL